MKFASRRVTAAIMLGVRVSARVPEGYGSGRRFYGKFSNIYLSDIY
jgi:hypothetical protein